MTIRGRVRQTLETAMPRRLSVGDGAIHQRPLVGRTRFPGLGARVLEAQCAVAPLGAGGTPFLPHRFSHTV